MHFLQSPLIITLSHQKEEKEATRGADFSLKHEIDFLQFRWTTAPLFAFGNRYALKPL